MTLRRISARPPTERARQMTLCIAGHCVHEGRPAIVVCADTQGTDVVKSFDTYKIRVDANNNIAIMLCGTISSAKELIAELEPVLAEALQGPDPDDLKVTKAVAQIKRLTEKKLGDKKVGFMRRQYGLEPLEFYRSADEKMRQTVEALNLDCSLLICHAAPKVSVLLYVDPDGVPSWEERYFAIGSGAWLARAFLSQSDWHNKVGLMEAAGRLYAAKKAAESDVGVGEKTQMAALLPERQMQSFTKEGMAKLHETMPRIVASPSGPALASYLRDASITTT